MKLLIALLLLASPVYAQGNATITGSLTFSDDPFGCSYGPHGAPWDAQELRGSEYARYRKAGGIMARPVRFTRSNLKPESEFKRACLKWLRFRFGKHFWTLAIAGGPYQRPGSPDVVCSLYGHFLALEFKDPGGGGRIGPRQQEIVDEIRCAGGRAHIIASWEDMEAAVDGFQPVQLTMRAK